MGCAKIKKKNNSGARRLIWIHTEPRLHTTMRPPPTTTHITTQSPLTERHIWISPHIVTAQYQQQAITSRCRQLLMIGTWLHKKTCWATSRREIKNTKVTSSWVFLSTLYKISFKNAMQFTDYSELKFAAQRSPSMDALPANRSWQPSCSHGTYQHKAITSRSRQLLMMGTWLPETCWATIIREIKNTISDI